MKILKKLNFIFKKTRPWQWPFAQCLLRNTFFFHDHSVESTSRQLQTDRNGARQRRENFWLKKKKNAKHNSKKI